VPQRGEFSMPLDIYGEEGLVATHMKRPKERGWSTVPSHHALLWEEAVEVASRDLSVYEEVARCSY